MYVHTYLGFGVSDDPTSSSPSPVSRRDVYELSGVVPDDWVEGLEKACATGSFEKVQKFVDDFMCEGFSVAQLFLQLHSRWVLDPPPGNKKSVLRGPSS